MHTSLLHPPGRWCLALTVCVGVCQSKGQHHQSSGCTQQPSTLTHTHTCSHKLYIFFNFQLEGQHHNKRGTSHVLCLQGQTVYVLHSPFFGSCKCAIISAFMYITLVVCVFACLPLSRTTTSQWIWATPWPLTTQASTRSTCSCTRLGNVCGTFGSPALKSTLTSNLPATVRASSTTA